MFLPYPVVMIHYVIRACIPDYECVEIFMCGDAASSAHTITDFKCFRHGSKYFVSCCSNSTFSNAFVI